MFVCAPKAVFTQEADMEKKEFIEFSHTSQTHKILPERKQKRD